MDPEHMQSIAARDQLWSSVRRLLPEIDLVANGHFGGTERELQIVQLVARIVIAELKFREDDTQEGRSAQPPEL